MLKTEFAGRKIHETRLEDIPYGLFLARLFSGTRIRTFFKFRRPGRKAEVVEITPGKDGPASIWTDPNYRFRDVQHEDDFDVTILWRPL